MVDAARDQSKDRSSHRGNGGNRHSSQGATAEDDDKCSDFHKHNLHINTLMLLQKSTRLKLTEEEKENRRRQAAELREQVEEREKRIQQRNAQILLDQSEDSPSPGKNSKRHGKHKDGRAPADATSANLGGSSFLDQLTFQVHGMLDNIQYYTEV